VGILVLENALRFSGATRRVASRHAPQGGEDVNRRIRIEPRPRWLRENNPALEPAVGECVLSRGFGLVGVSGIGHAVDDRSPRRLADAGEDLTLLERFDEFARGRPEDAALRVGVPGTVFRPISATAASPTARVDPRLRPAAVFG